MRVGGPGGMLNISMLEEFPGTSFSQTSWVVVTAWCVSLLVSPLIVQLCRNYSIRLIAVIGKAGTLWSVRLMLCVQVDSV